MRGVDTSVYDRIDSETAVRVAAVIRAHDRTVRVGVGRTVRDRRRPQMRRWLADTLELPPNQALDTARRIEKITRIMQIGESDD